MSPTQQDPRPGTGEIRVAPDPARTRITETDVLVVGARCAGSATAMLLARAGHDVLVVDRATFPSDTISTHVIARTGMVQLNRWGVLPAVLASGAPPVTRIEFHTAEGVMARDLKVRHGIDHLLAPRRIVLDALLQQAARAAGATIRSGVSVDAVLRDDRGRVVGAVARDAEGVLEIRARYVVGADGLGSRVARAVGAPLTVVRPPSGAGQYTYVEGDWSAIEYHLGPQVFAGVFPTHDGAACVWACSPEDVPRSYRRRHGSPERALGALLDAAAPGLGARVGDATRTSPVRGMLRMPNHLRRPFGDGWALVGDAGYHRDAITGHGISDAFRDAELLAVTLDDALRRDRSGPDALAAYGRERDRMASEIFDITCELAAFPSTGRFVELQRQLARAIDDQAGELAARPLPHAAEVAA